MASTKEQRTAEFSLNTLKGELTRRNKNKTRTPKVRAKSYILPGLTKPQIKSLVAGDAESVEVEFSKAVVTVSVKA